jgi:predicted methyltransferase
MTASNPHQRDDPRIELVEDRGETTLLIDGGQAMQAWETDLMWRSADLLCTFGSSFLEVGLGLGISALRIARSPGTLRHTVVEKYGRVIDLFRERWPELPESLEIVHADILDHVTTLEPDSLDGIFFDPYFPPEMLADEQMWARLVPALRRALRRGGALVPFASTKPVLRRQFEPYFDRVVLEKRRFRAYDTTTYMTTNSGRAWIQAFVRTGTEPD